MDLVGIGSSLFKSLTDGLFTILPRSPIAGFIAEAIEQVPSEYIAWLNWFIPIGYMVRILATFLIALAAWNTFQLIMRVIKLIG